MKESHQMTSKRPILFFSLVGIMGIIMLAYLFVKVHETDRDILNTEFAGKVERIDYDVKQFPTIKVADRNYYIGGGYNTDHQIAVGDFLSKKKGSDVYTLIKQRTQKVIEFTK